MAALLARDKRGGTGLGQQVEVPMFECLLQFVLGEHLGGETWQPPIAPMGHSRMLAANRKPYATQDGHMCALMYNDAHWKSFLQLVGQPERYAQDARFTTQSARIAHIDALYGFVQEQLRAHTSAYWLHELVARDIPAMPMMQLPDLLTDPHLAATHAWLDVPHPHEGLLRQLRPPVRMSGTPTSVRWGAPRLGEHTDEVLREVGVSL
jgi:crotonobetainyl-CoA:carnitine CoA-transferase CaiB-like acyl-CoA transferase